MSVQHRTRMRTVADYGQYLSDIGGCCLPDGTLENENGTSYQACMQLNGFFVPGDAPFNVNQCPNLAEKGCCCSCSYVESFPDFFNNSGCTDVSVCGEFGARDCYNGGLKMVTECECRAVGGNWAGVGVDCSTYYDLDEGGQNQGVGAYILCNPNGDTNDVRWPGSCCNNGDCYDACSSQDCLDIVGTGPDADPNAAFYEMFICNQTPVCEREPNECAVGYRSRGGTRNRTSGLIEVLGTPQEYERKLSQIDKSAINYDAACVHLNEQGDYVCESLTKRACSLRNGIWAGLDSERYPISCGTTEANQMLDYIKNDKKISGSIAGSWELGQRVLNLPGRFAGIIQSQSSVSGMGSDLYGDIAGPPKETRLTKEIGKIGKDINKKYAIIISDTTHHGSFGTLSQFLKMFNNDKAFVWKIPQLIEHYFLYNTTKDSKFVENTTENDKDNVNSVFQPMINEYYYSTDFVKSNNKENKNLVYTYNPSTGWTVVCNRVDSRMNIAAKAIIVIEIV